MTRTETNIKLLQTAKVMLERVSTSLSCIFAQYKPEDSLAVECSHFSPCENTELRDAMQIFWHQIWNLHARIVVRIQGTEGLTPQAVESDVPPPTTTDEVERLAAAIREAIEKLKRATL